MYGKVLSSKDSIPKLAGLFEINGHFKDGNDNKIKAVEFNDDILLLNYESGVSDKLRPVFKMMLPTLASDWPEIAMI